MATILTSILLTLSVGSPVFAQDCSTKRFDQELGEVRDQNGSGWCYAYMLADLMSFYRKERVSASFIAFEHNAYVGRRQSETEESSVVLGQGGNPVDALKIVTRQGGLCRERDMPSIPDLANPYDPTVKAPYFRLRASSQSVVRAMGSGTSVSAKDLERDRTDLLNSFPKVTFEYYVERVLRGLSGDALILDLARKSCEKRIEQDVETELDFLTLKEVQGDERVIGEKVDMLLSADKPVLIGVFAEKLKLDQSGLHGLMIVGRELRETSAGSQCWYRLRNSWGTAEHDLAQGIEQDKGNYWIHRDQLRAMLHTIYWVKDSLQ